MDLINEDLIIPELDLIDKEEIIITMSNLMKKNDRLISLEEYVEQVLKREEIDVTAVGNGVAIPHGKTDSVKIPTLVFAKTKELVKWGDEEDDLVNLIFMIAVPESADLNEHLKLLAALSRKLINDDFRKGLLNIEDRVGLNKQIQNIFI